MVKIHIRDALKGGKKTNDLLTLFTLLVWIASLCLAISWAGCFLDNKVEKIKKYPSWLLIVLMVMQILLLGVDVYQNYFRSLQIGDVICIAGLMIIIGVHLDFKRKIEGGSK